MNLKEEKQIIGMIHTLASPGTPKFTDNIDQIISKALSEAKIYKEYGIDSLIIENMHDVPYLKRKVGPEVTSLLSIIAYEVKNEFKKRVGIQILAGANKEALAIAKSANLDFIRAEGFIFVHAADEGIIESDAGEILRYRKQINADHVKIYTDIKKKHSAHSITADVSILETAKAAEFFLSDGVIITGKSTGEEVDLNDLKMLKEKIAIPVLIGSGITSDNFKKYFEFADAFIVGSFFKKDGKWNNEIDKSRIEKLIKEADQLR